MLKRTPLLFLCIGSILALFLVIGTTPQKNQTIMRPLLEYQEGTHIVDLHWNPSYETDGSSDLILLEGFAEETVLSYLSTCEEMETKQRIGTFGSREVQFLIYIHTPDGLKRILLGDINISSLGTESSCYLIQNPDEVRKNLIQLLHDFI